MRVDSKVNKGKTETVSMMIGGSIFSEYPGNKVSSKHITMCSASGVYDVL